MAKKVIILGAGGRYGRAAVEAFSKAGWQVTALARSWQGRTAGSNITTVTGDAFDAATLIKACTGSDVIVNAINPPYDRWASDLPKLTASVISAAKATGATVMFPGNVYNYGANMPEVLSEATPHNPTVRKGVMRVALEQSYATAADEGVRTIVLRGGDFIEREKTGNWFDTYIAHKIANGRVVYPGPLDRVHAWAYLPDMARAMVGLAEKRADFAAFEQFGFPGYALTGRQLVALLEQVSGLNQKVRKFPWLMIRLLGLINPLMREVAEMAYLWRVPHRIDGAKLATALPDFSPTPVERALADAVAAVSASTVPVAAQVSPA